MHEAFAQFKIRRLKGVTEIRMGDDPSFRIELAKEMPQYAPLLSERAGSAPSFAELKSTPEAVSFIDASDNAGKTFTITLVVRGVRDVVTEKEVLFVDPGKRVCAVSSWSAEGGVSFRLSN